MTQTLKDFLFRGLTGILFVVIVVIPFSAEIGGIYWSFHRHGPVHGCIALVVPPYAWYRAVAFFWEDPEWKENEDAATEMLGWIIAGADNDNALISQVMYKSRVRTWIASVPPQDASALHDATKAFAQANLRCSQLVTLRGPHRRSLPTKDPAISALVAKFQKYAGLARVWALMMADYP